ncbi:hypothetical protein PPL_01155 [Heterostelium album PN500]|uniref:Xrn1 N-terminal domain-containing protein n=1 Tax=Heterostelium pallidum (strain ATCC 26659 / Pp 5 / PN500) TaxID=670386 RepID=D3AY96_HETP5|nr:hypothetical protein PPL_01155 [Heterostelium album PN500]EFA85923.1 hypothetical protein PPL_01155 [Heterostelium album PN500]|eukprot:XP_020438029.1 hypothetical protein PPL_01155 [Heterostelium album PN500]
MGITGLSAYLSEELGFQSSTISSNSNNNNNSNIVDENSNNNNINNGGKKFNTNRANEPRKADHVFIDMNGIIHKQVRRNSNSELTVDRVKRDLIDTLKNIMKGSGVFYHTKSIQFIFDGPGSRSKILLQRKRRSKKIEDLVDTKVNASLITPGTSFMGEMKQLLLDYSKKLLRESQNLNLKDIHVSGSDRWGEGEFKIFEHINSMNWKENTNVSIFTCDSDTILYALLSDANIRIHDLYDPKSYKDISKLKQELSLLVPQRDKKQVFVDFVLINLFRGNDLLPALQSFNFDSVWQAYVSSPDKLGVYNLETSEINWELLLDLLSKNRIINSPQTKISIVGEFRTLLAVLARDLKREEKLDFQLSMLEVGEKNVVDIVGVFDGQTFKEERVKSDTQTKTRFLKKFFDIDHPFWTKYKPLLTREQIDGLVRRMATSMANYVTANAEEPSIEHLLQHVSTDAWKHPEALDQLNQSFKKYVDTSKLTEFENSQLSFHPTLHLSKHNNSIFLREEILNSKQYTSPKHLETIPYKPKALNQNINNNNNFNSNNSYSSNYKSNYNINRVSKGAMQYQSRFGIKDSTTTTTTNTTTTDSQVNQGVINAVRNYFTTNRTPTIQTTTSLIPTIKYSSIVDVIKSNKNIK